MSKCLFLSEKTVYALYALWLALPLTILAACSTSKVKPFAQYSEYAVQAADSTDAEDMRWAAYLKSHFQKRATDRDCIIAGRAQDESQLQLTVCLDPRAEKDFALELGPHEILMKARTADAMLWLQYQFMGVASVEDGRISSGDLPPSMLSCKRDTAGVFAFGYRSIYTPTNTDADMMPILGVGNVDYDWGLWGHNLRKVFADGVPEEAYALVNGKRESRQFCFSSASLYKAYEQFVIDQYGDGSDGVTTRFAVMPDDNGIVCQCPACRKAGNTAESATPAVTALVERLAKRFPHQLFFTSAYATTRKPSARPLPANAGVVISAVELPFVPHVAAAKERETFEKNVKAWQKSTGRIYVWDYMRNFDDYLTPYPCLHHLQERLRYYRQLGIEGVFLNGSGYDYATFDDVQTYVLSQLLINPDVHIENCISEFYAGFYPKTGKILADYYTSLEALAAKQTLQIYAGIGDAMRAYLHEKELQSFITRLDKASKGAEETERGKLNRMLTALAFTRLEMAREGEKKMERRQIEPVIDLLRQHTAFEDMAHYRESDGDMADYLGQWQSSWPWLETQGDLLRSISLKDVDGKEDVTLLTDGKQGFVTDYHTGWVVTSASPLRLQASADFPSSATFEISFLHAPIWHIYAPSVVEAFQNGVRRGTGKVKVPQGRQRVTATLVATDLQKDAPVEIRIEQTTIQAARKTLACDEIRIRDK